MGSGKRVGSVYIGDGAGTTALVNCLEILQASPAHLSIFAVFNLRFDLFQFSQQPSIFLLIIETRFEVKISLHLRNNLMQIYKRVGMTQMRLSVVLSKLFKKKTLTKLSWTSAGLCTPEKNAQILEHQGLVWKLKSS